MAEHPATYQPKIAADAARFIGQLIAGFLTVIIAKDVVHLREFLSLTLGLSVFFLLGYWTPPKPTASVGWWILRVALFTGY